MTEKNGQNLADIPKFEAAPEGQIKEKKARTSKMNMDKSNTVSKNKTKPENKKTKKKLLKESLAELLQAEVLPEISEQINEKTAKLWQHFGGKTLNDYIVFMQIVKAASGDAKAFEIIREMLGEKPKEKQENTQTDFEVIIKNAEER